MLVHQGVYLPDGEEHFVEWMTKSGEIVDGRGSYQIRKLRKAMSYCTKFRVAVDVGGHVGLWSMQLAQRFEIVHAFEPVAAHRECYYANMPGMAVEWEMNDGQEVQVGSNGRIGNCWVEMHACAIGDHEGSIKIESEPTSSGSSRVAGDGDIPMHTLDSFALQDVDFVKIDTEGYELYVIRGAEETIKRCKPVMIVEQKGHGMKFFGFRKEEGVELLESWGMRRAENLSGDWIMVW